MMVTYTLGITPQCIYSIAYYFFIRCNHVSALFSMCIWSTLVKVNKKEILAMGPGLGVLSIIGWIDYFFPSLTAYTTIIGPIAVLLFGAISVFSDILPEPGYTFPVPDLDDLKIELSSANRFVFIITRMARKLTIRVNWVIGTMVYRWFYKLTKLIASFINYMKLARTVNNLQTINPPEPFIPKIDDITKGPK